MTEIIRTTWHFRIRLLIAVTAVFALFVGGLRLIPTERATATTIPRIFNYQAKIMDDNGITLADGDYDIAFALYDSAAGDTCLWSASDEDANDATIDCGGGTPDGQISVTVTDGIFSVLLGDTDNGQNTIPDISDAVTEIYLGVTVEADAEMAPRKRIVATLLAEEAATAKDLSCADCVDGTELADTVTLDAALAINLLFNTAGAFNISQTWNYFDIDTSDGSEVITFGNATTNPDYTFLGSGVLAIDGDVDLQGNLTNSAGVLDITDDTTWTLGATQKLTLDAATTDHTDNSGVLDINLDSDNDANYTIGLNIDVTDPDGLTGFAAIGSVVSLSRNIGDTDGEYGGYFVGLTDAVGAVSGVTGFNFTGFGGGTATSSGSGSLEGYVADLEKTGSGSLTGLNLDLNRTVAGDLKGIDIEATSAGGAGNAYGINMDLTLASGDMRGMIIDLDADVGGGTAVGESITITDADGLEAADDLIGSTVTINRDAADAATSEHAGYGVFVNEDAGSDSFVTGFAMSDAVGGPISLGGSGGFSGGYFNLEQTGTGDVTGFNLTVANATGAGVQGDVTGIVINATEDAGGEGTLYGINLALDPSLASSGVGLRLKNNGIVAAGSGVGFAGGSWTNGIDFSGSTFTNDITLQNGETISNAVNGTIAFGGATTLSATSATTFNCVDCINGDDLADSITLDARLVIASGLLSDVESVLVSTATSVTGGESGAVMHVGGSLIEAGAGNHTLFAGLRLDAPGITGGPATLSDAATLYIQNATSGVVSGGNYAIFVDDGNSMFDANVVVGGSTSRTETLANAGFSLGGDDLFVAGTLGVEGNVYTDGAVTITGSADGTDALTLSAGDILVSNGDLDLSGGDFNVELDDGDTANIDGDGSPTADILKIGNGDTTASAIDGLDITLATAEGSSGTNLLNLNPAFAATTNGSTFTVLNIANFSSTATDNNLIVKGINIGNISDMGSGTTSSTALIIGDGWDTDINAATLLEIAISGSNEFLLGATSFSPYVSDGNALGTGTYMWSDLFLASGAVINFNNSDVTIRHEANNLVLAGGALSIAPDTTGTFLDFQLETEWTGGTLINADFSGATTQTDHMIGINLDFGSNVTGANGKNMKGIDILTIGGTYSGAGTEGIRGVNITGPAITNTAAGSVEWTGIYMATPSITQTAGIITAYGMYIATGGITTGGSQKGIVFSMNGVGVGTLTGIDLGGITAGAGTETAISIGTGWDSAFKIISNLDILPSGATGGQANFVTLDPLGSENDIRIAGSLCIDAGAGTCPTSIADGSLRVDTTGGSVDDPGDVFDVAEFYPASEPVEPGDVLVVDRTASVKVKKSTESYAPALGVASTSPAIAIEEDWFAVGGIRQRDPLKPLVALVGRVPVKVTNENGPIEPGDPLTSSSTHGYAMKATEKGYVIGTALEPFSGDQGTVRVFVNPGWFNGAIVISADNTATSANAMSLQNLDLENDFFMHGGTISGVGKILADNGSWSIDETGKLIVKEIETEKLTAEEVTARLTDERSMIGDGLIPTDTQIFRVNNDLVGSQDKVFVTFRSRVPSAWWVSEIGDKYFEISLAEPNPDGELAFDYWIVKVMDERTASEVSNVSNVSNVSEVSNDLPINTGDATSGNSVVSEMPSPEEPLPEPVIESTTEASSSPLMGEDTPYQSSQGSDGTGQAGGGGSVIESPSPTPPIEGGEITAVETPPADTPVEQSTPIQ